MVMRSKLAIWSLSSIILIFMFFYLLSVSYSTLYMSKWIFWFILLLYLVPLGLGISALISIKRNKDLKGKWMAIVGIALSLILFIIGIVSLLYSS